MRRMWQLQIGWLFLVQWGDTSHQLVDLEVSESYIQCRSVYMSLLVGFNMSLRLLGKGDGRTWFDDEYYSSTLFLPHELDGPHTSMGSKCLPMAGLVVKDMTNTQELDWNLSSHTVIGDQHLSILTQTQEWMVWWDIWDYSKAWIFSKQWSPIGLWVQDLSKSVTTLLYEWDRALWSRLVKVSHNTALGCVCVYVGWCQLIDSWVTVKPVTYHASPIA